MNDTYRTEIRQILHDGQPAVEVTTYRQSYLRRDINDILGERKAGTPLEPQMIARHYHKFTTPRPIELFGMPVVGQWRDTEFNHLRGTITENTDPSTYIDYDAWVAAFQKVYGES